MHLDGNWRQLYACDVQALACVHSGLTKPGEGGEILALFQLMLLFLDSKVPLFLFASHSFLANYLHFMVKLIDKAIVINVKIHKNERKRLYSSNKDN